MLRHKTELLWAGGQGQRNQPGQAGHQGCAKWGTKKDKRASGKKLADANKRDTWGLSNIPSPKNNPFAALSRAAFS